MKALMRGFVWRVVGLSTVLAAAAYAAGAPSHDSASSSMAGGAGQGGEGPLCLCAFPFQPRELDLPCADENDLFCVEVFNDDFQAACLDGFCFGVGHDSGFPLGLLCQEDQLCRDNAGGDVRARCVRADFPTLVLTAIPCVLPVQDDPDTYCRGNPCVISGDIDVQNGANVNFGSRTVVVEGTLSVGDGSMTIRAGEFRIAPQGQLDGSGGFGGSFDILVTGDIRIDGERDTGAINLVAEEGGFLSLTSQSGSILGTGDILFGSASDEGDAGRVDLTAGADINFTGSISGPGGADSRGGELEIFAHGDVTLSGGIDLSGGFDGGLLFIEALDSVTLGVINLDGTGDRGNGGEIDIRAGGSVELGGTIHSRGSDLSAESCGDGGRLSIEAGADLTTLAEINVNARAGECRGGEIELTADRIDIGGPISFSAEGEESLGGFLDVAVNKELVCRDRLEGGGMIMIGPIIETTLECEMQMIGPLEIMCDPIVIQCEIILIAGPITSGPLEERSPRGVAPTGSGSILISGCGVEIAETAQLVARGPSAFNRITSGGSATVAGDMTATSANEFRFRPGFEPIITGQVVPAPSLNSDDTLQPCALPEDTPTRTATPTETATNTPTPIPTTTPSAANTSTAAPSETVTQSQTRTPTLTVVASTLTPTASATPGVAGPGDANCDGRISAADLVELVTLIPSNDLGECGLADADQSGVVDELDIPATVRLIFE